MKFNYLANKILKEQESPYEHLYNIIDDYLIARGQTPTLQSIKQLWDQQGKQFGTQENFFKVLIAWSKEAGVKLPLIKENARRAAAGLDMDGLMADEERYNKAKAQSGSKYVYYDRSMQPGGGPGSAEYVEDLEDVKEIIEYSKKVKTPAGVDMWEDPEGNILIKVK